MLRPPDHPWDERWPQRPEPNDMPLPPAVTVAVTAVLFMLAMSAVSMFVVIAISLKGIWDLAK